MKKCKTCKETKPAQAFYKNNENSDRLASSCRDCAREADKKWRAKNPEKVIAYNIKNRLRIKFNLSVEDYDSMLKKQKGVCAICKKSCKSNRQLAVDHCHKTGKIRGLLCMKCNNALGGFEDNTQLLTRAIAYLKVYN